MKFPRIALLWVFVCCMSALANQSTAFRINIEQYKNHQITRPQLLSAYDALSSLADKSAADRSLEESLGISIKQLAAAEQYKSTFDKLISLYKNREITRKQLIQAYELFETPEEKLLGNQALTVLLRTNIEHLRMEELQNAPQFALQRTNQRQQTAQRSLPTARPVQRGTLANAPRSRASRPRRHRSSSIRRRSGSSRRPLNRMRLRRQDERTQRNTVQRQFPVPQRREQVQRPQPLSEAEHVQIAQAVSLNEHDEEQLQEALVQSLITENESISVGSTNTDSPARELPEKASPAPHVHSDQECACNNAHQSDASYKSDLEKAAQEVRLREQMEAAQRRARIERERADQNSSTPSSTTLPHLSSPASRGPSSTQSAVELASQERAQKEQREAQQRRERLEREREHQKSATANTSTPLQTQTASQQAHEPRQPSTSLHGVQEAISQLPLAQSAVAQDARQGITETLRELTDRQERRHRSRELLRMRREERVSNSEVTPQVLPNPTTTTQEVATSSSYATVTQSEAYGSASTNSTDEITARMKEAQRKNQERRELLKAQEGRAARSLETPSMRLIQGKPVIMMGTKTYSSKTPKDFLRVLNFVSAEQARQFGHDLAGGCTTDEERWVIVNDLGLLMSYPGARVVKEVMRALLESIENTSTEQYQRVSHELT